MIDVNKIIPYGRHHITEEDILAVSEVLRSDYLTQGPKIKEFEEAFADFIGCKYAVAVSSGTAALHLSAIAMQVGIGDKVITSPITFCATANCIRYCGGEVVFADINPDTFLLDIDSVLKILKSYPKGTIKGLIPVDFSGRAINLEAYRNIADEYGLWIIEDACHAPGGHFIDSNGKIQKCGNGKFADLAIFSFHPVKHIATGEGGMITTNNERIYSRLLNLRTHGISRDNDHFINSVQFATGNQIDTNHSESYPGWYMELQELGYNYRLTDIQAALGLSQIKRAESGLMMRKTIAGRYAEAFKKEKKIIRHSGLMAGHAYHLYIIEIGNRIGLYNFLKSKNIFAQVHYIPCHLMPYYKQFGWKEGDLKNAESYYKHCLSLPIFPTLEEAEQNYIITLILQFLNTSDE